MNDEIRELLDELASAAAYYENCMYRDRKIHHDAVFTCALRLGEAWAVETADTPE